MSDALSDIRKADRNRPIYSEIEYEKVAIERDRYLNNWLCEQQRINDVIEQLKEYHRNSDIPKFNYSMSSTSHEKHGMHIAYSVAISLLKNGVK